MSSFLSKIRWTRGCGYTWTNSWWIWATKGFEGGFSNLKPSSLALAHGVVHSMVGNSHSLLFHGSTMSRRSCAKKRTWLYTRKRGPGYSFQHLKKLSINGNWPKRLWSWWLGSLRYPLSLAPTQLKRRRWLQVGTNIVNIDSSCIPDVILTSQHQKLQLYHQSVWTDAHSRGCKRERCSLSLLAKGWPAILKNTNTSCVVNFPPT